MSMFSENDTLIILNKFDEDGCSIRFFFVNHAVDAVFEPGGGGLPPGSARRPQANPR
jgi:hypothetical protein